MPFGLDLNFSKQKGSKKSTLTQLETLLQQGSEKTNQTTSGTQSIAGSQSGSSVGTSQSTQDTNQTNASTGTTSSTGTSRSLDEGTAGSVAESIRVMLADMLNPTTGDRGAINAGLSKLDFNTDDYVRGTMESARSLQGDQLDAELGSLFSRIGGTAGTNSAAALLANKARGSAAANLAGIEAQARANAAGIQQGNVKTAADTLSSQSQLIPALLASLKGANVTTDQTQLAEEIAKLTGQTAGTATTTEQSNQQTAQTTTSVQQLIGLVEQLLNSTTNTVGTEDTKTKGSGFGGSMSLKSPGA